MVLWKNTRALGLPGHASKDRPDSPPPSKPLLIFQYNSPYPNYDQAVYFDVLSALDKASLVVLQMTKFTPSFKTPRNLMAYPLLCLPNQ
jgi:hypothetical protein